LCGKADADQTNVALIFTRALLDDPLLAIHVGTRAIGVSLAARRAEVGVLAAAAEAVLKNLAPSLWVTKAAAQYLAADTDFIEIGPRLGWLTRDERFSLGPLVVLEAAPQGLEDHIERSVPAIFDAFWGYTPSTAGSHSDDHDWAALPDPWLEEIPGGVRVRRAIKPVLELLGRVATNLAPDFVRQQGGIVARVNGIERWASAGRHIEVQLQSPHDQHGLPLSWMSTGAQRWVAASLREACRQLSAGVILLSQMNPHSGEILQSDDPEWKEELLRGLVGEEDDGDDWRPWDRLDSELIASQAGGLFLVDEPELHLHPRAQQDVANWLRQRSAEHLGVLAATHSSAFLSYPPEQASVIRVYLGETGTRVEVLDADLLGALDALGPEVGLGRAAMLQLARGVLAVEGEHDKLVIEHFFRRALREQRILVVPLRGAQNALSIAEGEILPRLGLPISVILDQGEREKRLIALLDSKTAGAEVRSVQYDEPDIICALPESAVRRAYRDKPFPGWSDLISRHGGKSDFKGHALAAMGLTGTNPGQFVREVLNFTADGEEPSPSLRRAVSEALSSFTGSQDWEP
jgi:hypothetical protein